MRASEKTGIPQLELENLVDEIEAELQQRATREVSSNEIGEMVLLQLQKLSEVAYVRFASVYRQFQGIRDFAETLHHLQDSANRASFDPLQITSSSDDTQDYTSEPNGRETSPASHSR
jgi:transcriptional repressor NrdR